MILDDIGLVRRPQPGVYRFCARAGSSRRYGLWVGLADATADRSLQMLWGVRPRLGPGRSARSWLITTLAGEESSTWPVVDSGRAMVSFDELWYRPVLADALLPLKLVRPRLTDAVDLLTREGSQQRWAPGRRRRRVHISAQPLDSLLTIRVAGLVPEHIVIGPAEAGEEEAIPSRWPPIVEIGWPPIRQVKDWPRRRPSAAPTTWSAAFLHLRQVFNQVAH